MGMGTVEHSGESRGVKECAGFSGCVIANAAGAS